MSTVQEQRSAMVGVHFTQTEKDFIRIHAAKNRLSLSSMIHKEIAEALSKIEDPENPFYKAKK